MNSSSELEQKKAFLKSVTENYDSSRLIQFCIEKKENGDDLNVWTLDELKEAVGEFCSRENEIRKNEENVRENNEENIEEKAGDNKENVKEKNEKKESTSLNDFLSSITSQSNTQPNNQNSTTNIQNENIQQNLSQNNPQQTQIDNKDKMQQKINNIQNVDLSPKQSNSQAHYKEICCKKLEKTPLNDKKISIIIRDPKASEKSLLMGSYITYEIFTENLGWSVRRRYSDFEWLRSILRKLFPKSLVAPLPGKQLGSRRFEQDFIEKRMRYLQIFLDEICKNEAFKASECLLSFLSFTDRNQFESKMKEMNSFTPSSYCEDAKTISGTLIIYNDDNNENFFTNIANYFKFQTQVYNRLMYNMSSFHENMEAICGNLEEISKDFDTLYNINVRASLGKEVTKTFNEMNIFFNNWKKILSNQNETISAKIKEFYNYQKLEGVSFMELIESRESIKKAYMNEQKSLNAKKEKLWSNSDTSKWEIYEDFNNTVDRNLLLRDKTYAFQKMCTRETQSLDNIHKQLGYANYMIIEELKKILNSNYIKFVEKTKEFANDFYPSLTDGITVWSTLSSYI